VSSRPDPIDFREAMATTAKDRDALRRSREAARRMTTEDYLRFLQSFPAGEPDRSPGGFPGDELEL
jgi:hypothetical protein